MLKSQTLFFAFVLVLSEGTLYYYFTSNEPVSLHYGRVVNCIKFFSSNNAKQNSIPPSSTRVLSKPPDRLAVIPYLPVKTNQVYQFLVMLYGSWRFIVDHQTEFFSGKEFDEINDINLLVFCCPSICKEVHSVCTPITDLSEIVVVNSVCRCYAIEQPLEADISYAPLNSFIMFNRTDITELIQKYKYILRTDNDVFLTPAMYKLKPTTFLHGNGGYSHPFDKKRLNEVASRLQLTHRDRHAIGSTWSGDTTLFIKAAKLTLHTTRYIYLNEFDPKAKGLETINFTKHEEGEWIRWWRPVSSLYGGELALNHLLTNFSDKNKGQFDSTSCDNKSIWKTPHIHCWHNDCEFQKFKFMKYLNIAINSQKDLPGAIVHRIIENTYPHNIKNMSLREYSTYMA